MLNFYIISDRFGFQFLERFWVKFAKMRQI